MKNPWKQYSKLSPQRENGNRQIASDVFRALMKAELSGSEFRIVLAIIDKTWGFNKESDSIAVSQLMEMTGLAVRTVRESIKILKEKRILVYSTSNIRVHHGAPINEFLFNKHYDTWRTQGCTKVHICRKVSSMGAQKRKTRVRRSAPTIETITKEILQKKGINPEIWTAFMETRKEKRAPSTDHAIKLILNKLEKFRGLGMRPDDVINQSIERGWTSVFELKGDFNGNGNGRKNYKSDRPGYDPNAARVDELAAEANRAYRESVKAAAPGDP